MIFPALAKDGVRRGHGIFAVRAVRDARVRVREDALERAEVCAKVRAPAVVAGFRAA